MSTMTPFWNRRGNPEIESGGQEIKTIEQAKDFIFSSLFSAISSDYFSAEKQDLIRVAAIIYKDITPDLKKRLDDAGIRVKLVDSYQSLGIASQQSSYDQNQTERVLKIPFRADFLPGDIERVVEIALSPRRDSGSRLSSAKTTKSVSALLKVQAQFSGKDPYRKKSEDAERLILEAQQGFSRLDLLSSRYGHDFFNQPITQELASNLGLSVVTHVLTELRSLQETLAKRVQWVEDSGVESRSKKDLQELFERIKSLISANELLLTGLK